MRLVLVGLALSLACSGCTRVSKGSITIQNHALTDVTVQYRAETTDGVVKLDDDVLVEAATVERGPDGQPILGADGEPKVVPTVRTLDVEAPRKGRIDLTYRPGTADSLYYDRTFQKSVADNATFKRVVIIPQKAVFDARMSIDELRSIAEQVDAGPGRRALRLVDVEPRLNAVFVATVEQKEGAPPVVQRHQTVLFEGPPLERKPPQELKVSAYVDAGVMSDASLKGSIFASLDNEVQGAKVYSLIGDVRHYEVSNNFNLAGALQRSTPEKRLELARTLDLAPAGARLYYVHGMHVIEHVVFSTAEGESISGRIEASSGGLWTASGSYRFGHEKSRASLMTDVVTRVDSIEIADLSLVRQMIGPEGQLIRVRDGLKAKPVDDPAIGEALVTTDSGD